MYVCVFSWCGFLLREMQGIVIVTKSFLFSVTMSICGKFRTFLSFCLYYETIVFIQLFFLLNSVINT